MAKPIAIIVQDKLAVVEKQLIELDPEESSDELTAFTVQCHVVGFILGVIFTVGCFILWNWTAS